MMDYLAIAMTQDALKRLERSFRPAVGVAEPRTPAGPRLRARAARRLRVVADRLEPAGSNGSGLDRAA